MTDSELDDFVIDTNVWVMVDKIKDVGKLSLTEIDCIDACQKWLRHFSTSHARLVVDGYLTRKILTEYRRNIKGRQAQDLLNQLERLPRERLVEIDIAFDADGFAILPFHTADPKDRKFIAVALAHAPMPPIVDATDTDWTKEKINLNAYGITIIELCPEYISAKLAG